MGSLGALVEGLSHWWPVALIALVGAVWTGIEVPGKIGRLVKSSKRPEPRKLHYRNVQAYLSRPDAKHRMSVKADVQLYNPEDVDLEIEVESLRTSVRDRVTDPNLHRTYIVPASNDRVHVQSEPVNITLQPGHQTINCFVDWVLLYKEAGSGAAPSRYCIRGYLECKLINGSWENRWTPAENVEWPLEELAADVTEDRFGLHTRFKE